MTSVVFCRVTLRKTKNRPANKKPDALHQASGNRLNSAGVFTHALDQEFGSRFIFSAAKIARAKVKAQVKAKVILFCSRNSVHVKSSFVSGISPTNIIKIICLCGAGCQEF
ncbi:MAG: hypothetical protein IKU72_04170 [Oscillospiraceae bacterium]|nr:hypothetical protein [Oscillospiraceae bacterium]